MFRFLGWILAGAASALDLSSTTVDLLLGPIASQDNRQSSIRASSPKTPSLASRHEDGRVNSNRADTFSPAPDEETGQKAGFYATREYFESQESLSEGYSIQAEHLRSQDFKRLGSRVYVDHAGATLYSEKQLDLAYKVQPTLSTVEMPTLHGLQKAMSAMADVIDHFK